MTVGLYLKRKSACDPGFGRDREAAEVLTGASPLQNVSVL